MEECISCSNVMTSLGLFANSIHLTFKKKSLSGFLRKNSLMTRGRHFGGFDSREKREQNIEINIYLWKIPELEEED